MNYKTPERPSYPLFSCPTPSPSVCNEQQFMSGSDALSMFEEDEKELVRINKAEYDILTPSIEKTLVMDTPHIRRILIDSQGSPGQYFQSVTPALGTLDGQADNCPVFFSPPRKPPSGRPWPTPDTN